MVLGTELKALWVLVKPSAPEPYTKPDKGLKTPYIQVSEKKDKPFLVRRDYKLKLARDSLYFGPECGLLDFCVLLCSIYGS